MGVFLHAFAYRNAGFFFAKGPAADDTDAPQP